jgi:hypothetical protein
VDAIPIPPSTSTIALNQVSVATAWLPVAIKPSMSRLAWAFNPMRATIACLMSPPTTDEVTARNGKADSTASAANAKELFMKSAVER